MFTKTTFAPVFPTAQGLPAALWFVIGLLLATLLVYASAKYGIADPDGIMAEMGLEPAPLVR
jgi:hypothetical protein